MKFLGAIALTGLFLLPNSVLAACVGDGATVVYINGVFTTNKQAVSDLNNLKAEYIKITKDEKTPFINGYNPSHIGGLGDLAQSAAQIVGKSISNFDRDTILLQIYPQVTTRKLLLVGHSQGAFYSNALYDYLVTHSEPKAAVGVYQVASPASSVAGGGKYLNSSGDVLLGTLRGLGLKPLPDNIDLVSSPGDAKEMFAGHSFSGAYLAEAPDRIVSDMQGMLKNLKVDSASDTGECFTPPNAGLGYQAAKAGFAVADTAANGVRAGAGAAQVAAVAAGNALAAAAQGAYGIANKLVADIGITVGGVAGISHAAEPSKTKTNFDIFSRIYGSSVSKDDYKDLMGDLGGAVATAPIFAAAPEPVAQAAPAPQSNLSLADNTIVPLLAGSGGARHHHDSAPHAPESAVSDTAPIIDVAPAAQDTATTTDEATTTPSVDEATSTPEVPLPHFAPATSPVTDSFDSYDDSGSGWMTYGGSNNFGTSPGVVRFLATTSGECHSGGCLSGAIQITNGGYGNPTRMYKTGTPTSEGSLTVWKRIDHIFQGADNVWLLVCAGAPDTVPAACEGTADISRDGSYGSWQEYFVAWRNNGDTKEFCHLRNDTDQAHCTWQASAVMSAAQAPDTIAISGDPIRPDLGDRLWFDDLGSP